MRLPFPERIPFVYALMFAGVLTFIQLIEGSSPPFSLACFFFVIISALAFNQAGGFTRCSGAYIFFYAILTVIIGITWKAILGEPAQTNLEAPLTTIYAFLGIMCGMFIAVLISQKLTLKRAILENLAVEDDKMRSIIMGCLVTGVALTVMVNLSPFGNGSILSALNQLNRFLLLTIILGVTYTIRQSGGRRSIGAPVVIAMFFVFLQGAVNFSKEGMFTPFACWLIAAASQRFYVSRAQMLVIIVLVFGIFYYLVPFSQYGRTLREDTISKNVHVGYFLLTHPDYLRARYKENVIETEERDADGPHYYDTGQGFFDRLQAMAMDGALIAHTVQFGTFGYMPVIAGFENLVPHFIWHDKPVLLEGNYYAHELGLLADEDYSTGVSFSSAGEGFHIDGWVGILILAPAMHILFFTVFDSLCGDVRRSVWGLLAIAVFVHLAPEGGIGGLIYGLGFITTGIAFMAIVSYYLMPIIGSLVIGPSNQPAFAQVPGRPLSAGPYRG